MENTDQKSLYYLEKAPVSGNLEKQLTEYAMGTMRETITLAITDLQDNVVGSNFIPTLMVDSAVGEGVRKRFNEQVYEKSLLYAIFFQAIQ